MRRRKEFTFCLFSTWFDVLLSMLPSDFKQTALFNNSFLNADEAGVTYPFTSELRKYYCVLSWALFFLAWSTICFCAGQARNAGGTALKQWWTSEKQGVDKSPGSLTPDGITQACSICYIQSSSVGLNSNYLQTHSTTILLSLLTHWFPHSPPGISWDCLPNKLLELKSVRDSFWENTNQNM